MANWQLRTPVAFIIFRRADTTEKVFEVIRKVKPPKLLVVADGPSPDRPSEAEKCAATRSIIERVDWDCEVLKNYADENMGCKKRVSSGLDWVFSTVEEAIILEDDCLPHPTFFRFCEELLDYYRHDTRVMHIAGNNFGISGKSQNESYYFSRIVNVWGWATWQRAWQYYDVNLNLWPDVLKENRLLDLIDSKEEAEVRRRNWEQVYQNKIDTWDYQWFFTCLCQNSYAIAPSKNLISNIGFNLDSTHTVTSNSRLSNLKIDSLRFPLTHPKFVLRYRDIDRDYFNKVYKINFLNKMIKKIKTFFVQ